MNQPSDLPPAWVLNPSLAPAYLEHLSQLTAELAAGAGHEINNPLATILGHVQLLLRGETDPDRRRSLEAIGGQTLRIRDMIGDLMLIGRPPEPVLAKCAVSGIVREVIAKLGQEAATRRILIDAKYTEDSEITSDANQIRIVVGGLIRNAFEAMADGGTLSIEVTPSDRATETAGSELACPVPDSSEPPIPGVEIQILDTGKGFGLDELRWAFSPFFSGRQAGRGLGFGLPKCQTILSQLHGTITLQNRSEGGVSACVWLPMVISPE